MARVERELAVIRGGMEEVAEAVPEIGKGPLEKAKDALSGLGASRGWPHAGTRAIVTRYSGSTRKEPSLVLFSRS